MTGRGIARVVLVVACVALVHGGTAPAAAASDGGSGRYTATGSSYYLVLFNSGTTAWRFFTLVGPSGARFVGGGSTTEVNASCVVGQADGRPDELTCGPLPSSFAAPLVHFSFIATLQAPVACGAPFELYVSATGTPPFTRVGEVTYSGSCAATLPHALMPPTIEGTPLVGNRLRATPPLWSASPDRVAYQWQRCTRRSCSAIRGATKLALRLGRRDRGHTVRIVATARVDGETVTSRSPKMAIRAGR